MDLNTKINEMQRSHIAANQGYKELANSLEVENLWPDVFKEGKCKAAPVKLPNKHFITTVRITSGSSKVRYIPVSELDKEGYLWKKCREHTPNLDMFDRIYNRRG
jgi:hypothetical protein